MANLQTLIKDLVTFYVKTNYEKYLMDHNIKVIPDDKINTVMDELYDDKKEHLTKFINDSLKELLKNEYENYKKNINLIISSALSNDDICKKKLICEIQLFQTNKN